MNVKNVFYSNEENNVLIPLDKYFCLCLRALNSSSVDGGLYCTGVRNDTIAGFTLVKLSFGHLHVFQQQKEHL